MTQLHPEVQREVLSKLQLAVRDAYCRRRRNVMYRFTQHRAEMKRRVEAKLKYEALAKLASAVAQAKAEQEAKDMELISQLAEVFKEFKKKPKAKDDTQFFAFRSVTKTLRLPEEDPMEFSPHGFDLSEVEVSDGGYYFDRPDNDPDEFNPYKGGDWYAKAVYGDRSLMGGRLRKQYSVLLRPEFSESLSLGLCRMLGFNRRALPLNPQPREIVSAWKQVIASKQGKHLPEEARKDWRMPIALWVGSLSSSEAGMYLQACRKEYASAWALGSASLQGVLKFAGELLVKQVEDDAGYEGEVM